MNKTEIESYKEAGIIAQELKDYAKTIIKPEIKLIEIANKIDKKIEELGGKPAFPINLSINEIAAHYTPSIDDETTAEGLLKIDLGVEIKGYIADTAFSIDLTPEKKYQEMIDLNNEILDKTIESLNSESKISDIGNKMTKLLEGEKYSIIKNLTGHELGRYEIHSETQIPNTKNQSQIPLKNKAIAIEPFLTTGAGEVIEGKPSEIFMLISEKNTRDSETRKLLNFIREEYGTKPFCKRWLDEKGFKTRFSLSTLVREEILHNFPVLVERSRGIVSQSEETIIFDKENKIVTTRLSS